MRNSFLGILSMSLLLASLAGSAQLEVSNGGFESFNDLPNSVGQWFLCDEWNNLGSASSHPDYYHVDGSFGGDLPQTPVANVSPWEGKAVMGLAATGLPGSNRRSYLSTTLSEPLVAGARYRVSFYITNGELNAGSFSGLGTSHLGLYFSEEQPVQVNLEPIEVEPQFERQNVMYDREWEQVVFTFTADAAYSHLTFGVFGNDSDKSIEVFEGSNPSIAYYFVDHFEIVPVPDELSEEQPDGKSDSPAESDSPSFPQPELTEDDFFIPNAFTPNGDGENDYFMPVLPATSSYTLCIYSRWGELLFKSSEPRLGWDGLRSNGREVPVGLYVWELSYKRAGDEGTREIQRTGSVNLIR